MTFFLDIDTLLTPIAGENPAGQDLRYEVYDQIKESRRDESGLSQGDWVTEVKTANWSEVMSVAIEVLSTRTKDLQIAAWLTEAMTRQHGFQGLRAGLELLRKLQDRFWDSLYPEIEDEDLEARILVLELLNRDLPIAIKQIPVTQEEQYSFLKWEESRAMDNLGRQDQEAMQAELADGKITGEQFDKAVEVMPRVYYETLFEELMQSSEACEQLDRLVDERLGRDAPSLLEIKKALENCQTLLESILKRKREQEPDAVPSQSHQELAQEGRMSVSGRDTGARSETVHPAEAARVIRSGSLPLDPVDRVDALRRLEAVAAFFRRTEPHSPVAYLVQRAARWGSMPLEDWLGEVIKDDSVLTHLRDTLGLKKSGQDEQDEWGGGDSESSE